MNISSQMPNVYRPPLGLPLRWQDEQSGKLPQAISAFFAHGAKQSDVPPTQDQLGLICEYMAYYVNAPCWSLEDSDIDTLRAKAKTLKTGQDIHDFIYACMEIGLDPL